MGRAAPLAFARDSADVAFGYRPQEEPDSRDVVELIKAAGRTELPLPRDIRDAAFCQRLVNRAAQDPGGLDILVNNAARQHPHKALKEIATDQFDWTFKTNVYTIF